MKIQKKLLYILPLLMFSLALCSCSSEGREEVLSEPPWRGEAFSFDSGVRTDMIGGQNYASGTFLSVLEENRLYFRTEISADAAGDYYDAAYYTYEQIDGLKDTVMQDKINLRVKEPAVEWCEKRPRITDELYAEQSDRARESAVYGASAEFRWSCCDYISGIMTRSIDYYDAESRTHSKYIHISPLNFDLRTGEEFGMEALFASGYDYLETISDAVLSYASANGLTIKRYNGITEEPPFCLSSSGLVIFLDGSYESQGLAANTAVTIPFDAFGDNWAIERACGDLYETEGERAYIMLRQSAISTVSEEKVYYDEGDKLSVRTVSRLPESFPPELKEDAKAFIDIYLPSYNSVDRIRRRDGEYLRQLFEISGERVGYKLCITLNASIKKSGETPWSATRYYVYGENGKELQLSEAFVQGFDFANLITAFLQREIDARAEEGWVPDSDVGIGNLDFLPDTEGLRFATLPVQMSRVSTAADGSQSEETRNESILFYISYDEIGFENLDLFKP